MCRSEQSWAVLTWSQTSLHQLLQAARYIECASKSGVYFSLDFALHHDLTSWALSASLSNFITNRFCYGSVSSALYAFLNW